MAATLGMLALSLLGANSASADSQVTNPCDRLNAGQVKYPTYGANRVTFATTPDRVTPYATVTNCVRSGGRYVQDWQTQGTVGVSGFKAPGVPSGPTSNEFSPTGSFSFTNAFGLGNPGTALSYQTLHPGSRWNGHAWTSGYNQYFEENTVLATFPDENMWYFANRPQHDYQQGAVINYNRQPDSLVIPNAGFAIFLHGNPVPTAGCVALPNDMVVRFLQTSKPGDRIVMGAVSDIFTPTSSTLNGAISTAYFQAGGQVGALGQPTSSEVSGLKNGGSYQRFQGGTIHWSPTTGAHITTGAIRSAWGASGFENGPLGYPTSNEISGLKDGGVYQTFQGGAVVWTPGTGAHVSTGAIRSAWAATGYENGKLGYATSNEIATPNGGVIQRYQGGAIIWSAATGARTLSGAIGAKYQSIGTTGGALGFPVGNEACGLRNGGCYQNFQDGAIYWSPTTGTELSIGAIRPVWQKSGSENGPLGYPTSDVGTGLKDGGMYQSYQGGSIHTSKAGTFITGGAIRQAWQNTGFENGVLGYPASNEYTSGNRSMVQDYQFGHIFWSATTGAQVLTGAIDATFTASGTANGMLGLPTGPATALPAGGLTQPFHGGVIVWKQATGAQVLTGAILKAWQGAGSASGKLGYPTAGAVVQGNGSLVQTFEGGQITVSSSGAVVISGAPMPAPAPSPSPTSTASSSPATEASPTPTATATATAKPTAPATPTASPTATAAATPTASVSPDP